MNSAATRPFAAAGIALLGAGVIAATPAIAPTAPVLPHLSAPEIALQASIVDLFKFPILRQIATNQVEVLAIEAQGLADASQGAVQSLRTLPPTIITATRQTLTGNPLDALTTLENWAVDSAKATFVPVISARIDVGQIDLAIQSALLPAWPLALVSVASGLFNGADDIARGLITAGQDLIGAVLSLNLQNIVQALVGGVQGIVTSIGAGAQSAIDGVVGAQNLIADALAARPVPVDPPVAAAAIAAPAKAPKAAPAPAAAVSGRATAPQSDTPAVEAPASKSARAHAAARENAPRRIAAAAASVAEKVAAQADSGKAGRDTSKRTAGRHPGTGR